MTAKAGKTLKTVLREHTGRGRCDLHDYMWRKRRALSRVLDKAAPEWTGTAAALAALGLTGMRGQAPTASSIRSMWRRIQREMAAEAAACAEAKPGRRPVNRSPRLAGPPPVIERELPRQAAQTPVARAVSPSATAGDEIELTPEAEAKFAALREQFAHADRYLGPQPKRKSR
jgi:hypothetical protein